MAEDDGTSAGAPPAPDEIVDLDIPGLENAVEIGVGGFALVFRAFQPAFQRTVAVKILTNKDLDEEARQRFERECQTMGSLSEHPNIVTIYGAGFTDIGRPYLVMAYLPGGSLQDLIDEEGKATWQEATLYGVHLAGALETAHRAQIFHRDIKPGNILMSQYGDAQLTDFGIARVAGGHETRSGALAVSLAHAPPEVLEGEKPSNAGDIYSLGSTIYEALAGQPAFVGEDNSLRPLLRRILNDPVPDLRPHGVPDEICTVIERSMAKDPEDRQSSALRFGIELQEARRIHGEDPGRLTVPDMRAHGQDIRFVAAGASPLRSKGAQFDLAKPSSELLTETTDMETSLGAAREADTRSRTPMIVGIGIVALVLVAAIVGILLSRSNSQVATGPGTSVVTEPPQTVVAAPRYTPAMRESFILECRKTAGNDLELCRCTFEEITTRIPPARFLELSAAVKRGEAPPAELQTIVDGCAKSTRTTSVPAPSAPS